MNQKKNRIERSLKSRKVLMKCKSKKKINEANYNCNGYGLGVT